MLKPLALLALTACVTAPSTETSVSDLTATVPVTVSGVSARGCYDPAEYGAIPGDGVSDRAAFQRALESQNEARDERTRLASAESFVASGQLDDAEQALKEIVVELPESGQARYRLGRFYQSQSRKSEALAAFAASAECAVIVGRDSLYETIAALRVGEGEFTGAIAAYRLELDVNPNNAAAHRRLGDLYAQDGRLGESLAEYVASLSIDPVDADAHASRAQTLLRLSRFADAEAAARTAVALKPDHEAAQYALGTALMRTERTEEGLSVLKEFERLHTATRGRNDAAWQIKLLTEQAREHAARQEYSAAADVLRRAMAYAPAEGSIRLAAGAFLVRAGKYEEAIPLLKEALARDAIEAHRYLADAYDALGQHEESRAHREEYKAVTETRVRQGAPIP